MAAPSGHCRRVLARRRTPHLPDGLELLEGGEEPFPGIRAIATPGHTPGHMVFIFGEIIFAGDAVRGSAEGLRLMPGFLTSDRSQAQESLELIAGLGARWLCPGHGRVRELHF